MLLCRCFLLHCQIELIAQQKQRDKMPQVMFSWVLGELNASCLYFQVNFLYPLEVLLFYGTHYLLLTDLGFAEFLGLLQQFLQVREEDCELLLVALQLFLN